MITPIQTFKAVCDRCGETKIFTSEGGTFFGYPLPDGWERVRDRPQADISTNTITLSFGSTLYSAHKEYCPTCYVGIKKSEEEREQREKHAEKYL